jgi:hypothetical protein
MPAGKDRTKNPALGKPIEIYLKFHPVFTRKEQDQTTHMHRPSHATGLRPLAPAPDTPTAHRYHREPYVEVLGNPLPIIETLPASLEFLEKMKLVSRQ